MTTVVDHTAADAPPHASGLGNRRVPALVATAGIALVLAALTAWLAIGLRPHLSTGPTWDVDREALEDTDPMGALQTSYVVDPSDGAWDGLWSFSNEGPVPVTVRIHPTGPSPVLHDYALVPLPPPGAGDPPHRETVDSLTVAPGRAFGVSIRFGMGCADYSDAALGLDRIELDVTTWGLTRTVEAGGDFRVLVMTEDGYVAGPDCRGTP
ncbi:hypothetical protein CWIS_10995 [Cellulomonas sp. A375-1]|uniref:hypothetical protein n=1 Tax=Cellulomonas sp. A375-1 TaxID=1672219 RepID=UPI0006526CC4|nr:hypothetical protein [Cellulomonas sp. A375-1]KMM45412.1 hypothetical protein CWIS_10995 [Cellulomonas sp. A375-1]